jgi:hypothetical protein
MTTSRRRAEALGRKLDRIDLAKSIVISEFDNCGVSAIVGESDHSSQAQW